MNKRPTDENYAKGPGRRDSVFECQRLCQTTQGCMAFTYQMSEKYCYLKMSESGKRIRRGLGLVSGRKYCDPEGT